MACYLEAIDLSVWRVICDGMKLSKNTEKLIVSEEKEIHFSTYAKNCLYKSLNIDIFNQLFTLKTINEIWLKLYEIHDNTSNILEQKTFLALNEYIYFKMKDTELV
jgi:hypothetical protein